jgi:hypothetical protein
VATAMVAAVAAGALVASPASAAGVDHYVSTTGTDAGNCQNIASPCLTINYAVGQAGTGDIINVAAGTYAEDVVVTKSLVFKGANSGVSAGTTPGVRGAESVVKTFRTGTGGTVSALYGPTALDITIDGFTVDPQGDAALIGSNVLAGLIHLHGGAGTGTSVVNNIVRGAASFIPSCTAFSCVAPNQMAPVGIAVGSGATDISDNRVENFRYGARTLQQLGASFSPLLATIDSNVITGVTVQGIGIGGATGVQQPGGDITNNEIDAIGRLSGPGGVVMTNAGNDITGNTFEDLGSGVALVLCKKWDSRNNNVDDNTFIGAPLTISVSTDGGQCATGSGGDIEGVGSWVTGGGHFDGFSANGNSFTGPIAMTSNAVTGFSANLPVTAGPIDVSCNFWGAASGPTTPSLPTGTGGTLAFGTTDGQPAFDFFPWESVEGSCTGTSWVSIGSAQGLERDVVTGSVFVPVFLARASATPTVVSFYTVDGTAIAGQDYTRWGTPSNPRTITIPAGALQSFVTVPVLTDNATESDESFSVVISSVSGGNAVVGLNGTGTGTILDSDGLFGPNPVIATTNGTVYEGDDGQRRAQFFIQLSRPPATNVTITYNTSDGTATAPGDYITKLPGTVVFAPGQISKTVDVLVNSNTAVGTGRDFFLNVLVTGGSPVEELNMTGVSTILDDD